MSEHEPSRLVSGPGDDPVLRRLGALIRAVPDARPVGRDALERVRARLGRRFLPGVFGLRVRALSLAAAVFALAGVAVAGFALLSPPRPEGVRTPPLPPPAAAPAGRRVPGPQAAPPVVVPPLEAKKPEARPAPREVRPEPASPASRLAQESAALQAALTALRRERDPEKALTLLDHHAATFPDGVLGLEARVARVDANLALGRRTEALALLERLPLERVGRGTELRLVRAELRAAKDPTSALTDFDAVLATSPAQSLDERALHGRAMSRRSLGDAAGARADAERYLGKYPNGRFAAALGPLAAPH